MVIYDFSFDGITLSSMGGEITEDNDEMYNVHVIRDVVTHKVPFVDGELFIKSVVRPMSFRIEMCFNNVSNFASIRNWFDVSEPKSFRFIPDFCGVGTIDCMVEDISDTVLKENIEGGVTAIIGVKFICYNPC